MLGPRRGRIIGKLQLLQIFRAGVRCAGTERVYLVVRAIMIAKVLRPSRQYLRIRLMSEIPDIYQAPSTVDGLCEPFTSQPRCGGIGIVSFADISDCSLPVRP